MKSVEIISHKGTAFTLSWTGLIDFRGECHPKGTPGFTLQSQNVQDIEKIKRIHEKMPEAFNLVEEEYSIKAYPTEGTRVLILLPGLHFSQETGLSENKI